MKKIKFLLIMCGVLIILATAYMITLTLTKDDDNDGDDPDETSTPLSTSYTAARVDITTLYAIGYNVGDVSYSFTLNDAEDAWLWTENPALPLDNTYFADMANALASVVSDVKLAADEDSLVEYGLDEPWLTVAVADETNGTQTFMFGKKNTYNGKYYFMSGSDRGFVYMAEVSAASPFGGTPFEMVKNDTLPTIPSDGISRITFSQGTVEWVYDYYPNGRDDDDDTNDLWYPSSSDTPLDEEICVALGSEIASLSFGAPAGYTEADKEIFGLAQPVIMTINYTEQKAVTDDTTGQTVYISVESTTSVALGLPDGEDGVYAAYADSVLSYRVSAKMLVLLYLSTMNDGGSGTAVS